MNTKNKKLSDAVARNLNVAPMVNTSPSYVGATATHYPTTSQYITVTLDKLRPYEHNPRRTRNPNFEMIKESIRRRGLDHKPNITQRPGEPFYIIADGGNTRIQALKELFSETQDQRFWSIECLYKPWKGETADSVEAELDLLIGHLIENDTRADLTFIEKALGIQQAKEYYEKKLGKQLSSRELSNELEKDGYIIQYTMIAKMGRCIEFLYPYIPDVLFNGLGNSPIDKLLAIRNNALEVWQQYQFDTEITFEAIWQNSLSRCNDDHPFNVKTFQDALINEMTDALEGKVSYEMLYMEVDLDERKFQKLAKKQQEIDAQIQHSEEDVARFQQQQLEKSLAEPVQPVEMTESESTSAITPIFDERTENAEKNDRTFVEDVSHDSLDTEAVNDIVHTETVGEVSRSEPTQDLAQQFAQNYGITPGMSIQAQREQQAIANGLEFACVGRQPVADIWQVYPSRQHKAEAYSLALDIAEQFELDELVEHVVNEPVDYSFQMKAVEDSLKDDTQRTIYELLSMLQTQNLAYSEACFLDTALLLGSADREPKIDDVTLVKLFRLIRLVRYLRASA
ncbi:TPA: ParB N-terminal domain-containing protein [Pasteurella multocida]|uniref:ParB family protein n=1 Tax=Pasteurella multocida TaxID=747 RepID=UPI0010938F18|nr:ParB family protein [Pasteurella multocida]QCA40341.1 chromosome partitioning protein ParB [Pasteurella multocida]HDX0985219.1 ParB N-terminal domain-containing protein [Pasteurella multocida]HDX0987552.1 ParB N-terminal domain-containing protein [Pasteurella multocida]HDX0992388.1 ParB N-terminal domain-containing protein [Pasteurella multocida]HDX0994624.1 ParB N-terminal domain-containing protein [Pasteurella multocida]